MRSRCLSTVLTVLVSTHGFAQDLQPAKPGGKEPPSPAIARTRLTPFRHSSIVGDICFSRDGKKAIGCGFDVRIWDVEAAVELFSIVGLKKAPFAIFIQGNDQFLIGVSDNCCIYCWDMATGKCLNSTRLDDGGYMAATSVAVSQKGDQVLVGTHDGRILIVDVRSSAISKQLKVSEKELTYLQVIPGETACMLINDGVVKQVDLNQGRTLRTYALPKEMTAVAQSLCPDGKTIAVVSFTKIVCCLDIASGEVQWTRKVQLSPSSPPDRVMTHSPDSQWLAVACDEEAMVLDAKNGKVVQVCKGYLGGITCVAFAPGGSLLATGGSDAVIRFWDVRNGEPRHYVDGHGGSIDALSYDSRQQRVATAALDGVRIWDGKLEKQLGSIDVTKLLRINRSLDGVSNLKMSASDNTLLTVCRNGMLRKWDQSGKLVRAGSDLGTEVTGLVIASALSADGKWVMHGTTDREMLVVNAENGTIRGRWQVTGEKTIKKIALAADASVVAASIADSVWPVDRTVLVWRLVDGKYSMWRSYRGATDELIALSGDGKRLAMVVDISWLRVVSLETGQEIARMSSSLNPMSSLALSTTGEKVVVGTSRGRVSLFDNGGRKLLWRAQAHRDSVSSIGICPSDESFATGGSDGTIALWPMK